MTILLIIDVSLLVALGYYMWRVHELEEASFQRGIEAMREADEGEDPVGSTTDQKKVTISKKVKKAFQKKNRKLKLARKKINQLQAELENARETPAFPSEQPQEPEAAGVSSDGAGTRPEDSGRERSGGEGSPAPDHRERATNIAVKDPGEPGMNTETVAGPERLLDSGLLPVWYDLYSRPDYENLRNVYDVFEAPDEFQLEPFPAGEAIQRELERFDEKGLADGLRTLSDLRTNIEDQLYESIFAFYNELTVKAKTITQLERNKEFPEYPFWKWFLKEKLDLTLDDPAFVEEKDFYFQRFMDRIIHYRRGEDAQPSEFLHSTFDRMTQSADGTEQANLLQKMDDAFDLLAVNLDELIDTLETQRDAFGARIDTCLDEPSLQLDRIERKDLLRLYRDRSSTDAS